MELAPEDRSDIKEACAVRLAVYQEFAPEEMSEEAIRVQVTEVLEALGIAEPSGKVMKELMPRVKGRADGGLVNKIVGEMLS